MNTLELIKLAKECPGLKVEITLGDLVQANSLLIDEVKRQLEQTIADENAETYLSREKVAEMLEVSTATLWRWQKLNYLVPKMVGGKRRYRKSDIMKILEGDK